MTTLRLLFQSACNDMNLNRLRRNLRIKAQLSLALLVAGLYSISHVRTSWGRIRAAFRIWFDFAIDPRRTPRWIYFGRVRACYRCPFFYKPLRTCGSPLVKDLRDMGCHCNVIYAAAVMEKTCWYRDQTNDDTEFGWDASLTRLSGLKARNKRGNATTPKQPGCSPCGRNKTIQAT